MPTSPSPRRAASRGAKKAAPPVAPARSLWPRVALIGVFAVLAVVVAVLPASLANKFLPPIVRAEDFSGTLWHGSAERITVAGRHAGALEWHLHPLALLVLHLDADLHWVKGSFVVDGATQVSRSDFQASDVHGGGPIADLSSLGMAAGWRGMAEIRIRNIAAGLSGPHPVLRSAVGEIDVSDLSSPQVAGGSDLGNYALSFDDASLSSNGDARAALVDKGGPLSLDASITFSPQSGTGMLSGTVKERADAPPALRKELDNVAQLHARDSQGRLPIDLEFTF
jgi:Type II secretion system (T2SS), protein N